jgi:hypothetical protein
MKALILALSLMSFNSFASTKECTQVLESMTKLTRMYIDLIKDCRALEIQGNTGGRTYEGYRRVSRGVESSIQNARDLCYRFCDDTFFCEGGELEGACTK